MAPPMTYELDGKQYIAVLAGHGGGGKLNYPPGSAPMTYQNYERLLVFTLGGGETPLPPLAEPIELNPIATGLPEDADTIAHGRKKFERLCASCHGIRNRPGGYPDLWNMHKSVHDNFDEIVLGGAYADAGMASFADVLKADDTLAIRAYIASDRRKAAEEMEGMEGKTGPEN